MSTKQLIMSVSKIFNWTQSSKSKHFKLSFYSSSTGQLIIQREVQAVLSAGMVHLNCNLKIGYTQDDHEIFLQLRYGPELVGQFKLNLQTLYEKKFQYFPFGMRDKVLQINLLEEENSKLKQAGTYQSNFIKERQNFLHNIKDKHKKLKRDFSEKVTRLLNEIHSVRNSGSKYESNRPIHLYDQQRNIHRKTNKPRDIFKFEDTDSTTNRKQHYNQYYAHQKAKKQTSSDRPMYRKQERESEGKSSISSNKKLMLNTLDIVPSQDYFEQKGHSNSKMPDLLPITSKKQIQKRSTTPPRQIKKQSSGALQRQYIQNFLNL